MRRLGLFLFSCIIFFGQPVWADELQQQRKQFVKARLALQQGRIERFIALRDELKNYPLYPYLSYEWLRYRLKKGDVSELEMRHFLQRYPDNWLGNRLRRAWLESLAKQKSWQSFLRIAGGSPPKSLRCEYLQALHSLGHLKGMVGQARMVWMSGDQHKGSCAKLFRILEREAPPASPLAWQRVFLAMQNSNIELARSLKRYLTDSGKQWLDLWIKVHQDPERVLRDAKLQDDTLLTRKIVLHGFKKLARLNHQQAVNEWPKLKLRYDFRQDQVDDVERYLAMRAAFLDLPHAHELLSALDTQQHDPQTLSWQVRSALRAQKWPEVYAAIEQLSVEEQSEKEWRYWRARSLEAMGYGKSAQRIYRELAKKTHYYGFLAADRLQQAYNFHHTPIQVASQVEINLSARDDIVRVREYRAVKLWLIARREWNNALDSMSRDELKAAALLAESWDWHDRALYTASKAKQFNDLMLRYPMPYKTSVFSAAAGQDLPPSLVYGVIRQESAYMPRVKSRVGAVGLMQLMPATAKSVARAQGRPLRVADLQTVKTNLLLGTHYYRQMLDRFGGNQAMACAAYNAGPHRVERWLPNITALPADIWVDTIPFTETRGYVKAVLSNATIFDWRMGVEGLRISERMAEVPVNKAF